MKAKIAAMLSAILVLAVGFAAACAPSEPSNVKMIFESNGGTAVQTIEQIAGSDVTEPAAPSRDGYTFEYWCSDQALETMYVFGIMPENDITLYAKWKANTYALNFDTNGGVFDPETAVPENYTVGTGLTLPLPAARNGYDFGGWFADTAFSGTAVTALSAEDFGDKTFYAKWTPATYSIEYVLNGLENHPDNPESYVFGTGAALQPAVNQGALGFMGWYDNAEFNGEALTAIDIDTYGNVTLYAKVQEGVYSLEYDNLLGGTHSNPSYYVSENGLTLTDATRENYDFLGWFDEDGEQVISVASGTTGAIKLTAKWSATEFDIVLNADGGVFDQGEAPASYTVEDDRTALPYPFKTGYAFVKWVDESGAEVTHFGGGNTGNIELTAQYLEQSGVEVGADGTIQRFIEAESKAIVIPDNAIKIPDHILYGDQTDSADHDVTYYPESLYIGKASRLEYIGNFSFYYTDNLTDGNWNPTGEFAAATINLPSTLKYIGNYAFSNLPFDFALPEENSLEFIGGAAFSGTAWEQAIPTEQEYVYFGKVLYKYQGGATEVNGIAADTVGIAGSAFESKTDITAITLPDGLRTIGDRAFAGCTGIPEIHIPSSVTKVFYDLFSGWTADQIVYLPFVQGSVPADWDVNWAAGTAAVLSYTLCNINYVLDNGINPGDAPQQYEPGTEVPLPTPTRVGFTFNGWFFTADFSGEPIDKITADMAGEITLYAKWTFDGSAETEYTITLETDGGVLDTYELKYYYQDEVKVLPMPLKAGYAFIKWVDENDAEVTSYGGEMTGNRTFTAVYEQGRGYKLSDATTINGWIPQPGDKIVVADDITRFETWAINGNEEGADWSTTEFFIGKNSRLTYIGDFSVQNMAFEQVDVYIPATVEHIGTNAFSYTNLRFVFAEDMPNLKYIGADAFLGGAWYNLILPTIDPESNDVYIGNVYYFNRNQESTVVIKDGTVAIAGGVFVNTSNVTSVVIPDSVVAIGDNAFGNYATKANGITEIAIPASVVTTGYSLFGSWTEDQTVHLPFAEGAAPSGWDVNWANDSSATFEYAYYAIEYELNGGTNAENAPTQYAAGESVVLPEPTKEGFDFDGWYLTENFEDPIISVSEDMRGNIKVYAKWTAQEPVETEYTITLETDGGVLDTYELKYYYQDEVKVLPMPLKAGYAFIKWVDENDAEVTSYGGEMVGNKTFTAVYEQGRGYTVDGTTVSAWQLTEDKKIVLADDVTAIGYYLNGGQDAEAWREGELFIGKNSRLQTIGDLSLTGFTTYFTQQDVYLPATLQHIGVNAFTGANMRFVFAEGMPNLTYIGVGAFENTAWFNVQLNEIEGTDIYIGNVYYLSRGGSGVVTLKEGTVGIAGGAFMNAPNVTSVVIPDSVVAIGDNAFGNYATKGNGIAEITIPASVVTTGYSLFGTWTAEQTVYLPFAENAVPSGWNVNWKNDTAATFVYAQ